MNITSGYIAYCIEGSAKGATGAEKFLSTGWVGEGGSDTPYSNYNIPPVTYRKIKKGFPKFTQKNKRGLSCA